MSGVSPSAKENIASQITKTTTTTTHLLQNPSKPLKTFNLAEQQILQQWGAPPTLLTDCQEQNSLIILSVSYNNTMNPQMNYNSNNHLG